MTKLKHSFIKTKNKKSRMRKSMKGGMWDMFLKRKTLEENEFIFKENKSQIIVKFNKMKDKNTLNNEEAKQIINLAENLKKSIDVDLYKTVDFNKESTHNSVELIYDIVDIDKKIWNFIKNFIEIIKTHKQKVDDKIKELKKLINNLSEDEEDENREMNGGSSLNTIYEITKFPLLSYIEDIEKIEEKSFNSVKSFENFEGNPKELLLSAIICTIIQKYMGIHDKVYEIIELVDEYILKVDKNINKEIIKHINDLKLIEEKILDDATPIIYMVKERDEKKFKDAAKKSVDFLKTITQYENKLNDILGINKSQLTRSRFNRLRKGFGSAVNSASRRLGNARNGAIRVGSRVSKFGRNIGSRVGSSVRAVSRRKNNNHGIELTRRVSIDKEASRPDINEPFNNPAFDKSSNRVLTNSYIRSEKKPWFSYAKNGAKRFGRAVTEGFRRKRSSTVNYNKYTSPYLVQ